MNPPFNRERVRKDVEAESRVRQMVAQQESDPVSLQMVRILRANGSSDTQIRQSLRGFFGPSKPPPSPQSIERRPSDQQMDGQQKIIDTLATEIEVLRTGNRIRNQYEELLRTVGGPLQRNAEELKGMELGHRAPAKPPIVSDYNALRAAVLQFLGADATLEDDELITQLNGMLRVEEEDREAAPAASDDLSWPPLDASVGQQKEPEETSLLETVVDCAADAIDGDGDAEPGEAQEVGSGQLELDPAEPADQKAAPVNAEPVAGASGNIDGSGA
jgi:hypothetical protein